MKQSIKITWTFIIIAVVATLLLAITFDWTDPLFEQHKADKAEKLIAEMLPQGVANVRQERFELFAPHFLQMGTEQWARRVYVDNQPQAIIVSALSKEAYGGRLGMLVAMDTNCTIEHVAVITESETPGLGDQYKKNNFAWLHSLKQRTVDTVWKLKQHDGDIDSWTGATITPKAMVKLIDRVQQMCEQHKDELFSTKELLYFEQSKPQTDYP